MFSGIAQAVVPIDALIPGDGSACYALRLPAPLLDGLRIGASVAVDGVCLTVTAMEDGLASFDVSDGTLAVTNLGDRAVGHRVNVERSLRPGDENGGHNVSGHVTGTARVSALNTGAGAAVLRLVIPAEHRRYVFTRGYLAVNGCSLTVAALDADTGEVTINLIPETIRQTSFSDYRPGDRINYEVELQTQIMVDTIERCIRQSLGGLTVRPSTYAGASTSRFSNNGA